MPTRRDIARARIARALGERATWYIVCPLQIAVCIAAGLSYEFATRLLNGILPTHQLLTGPYTWAALFYTVCVMFLICGAVWLTAKHLFLDRAFQATEEFAAWLGREHTERTDDDTRPVVEGNKRQ